MNKTIFITGCSTGIGRMTANIQTEYGVFLQKVMAGMQKAASVNSEPVIVAEKKFEAATDGKNQLRYIAGPDAEQIIVARKQMDDNSYIAMIKENMGL